MKACSALALLCFASLASRAQIPPQDARNVEIPNTDTHFTPRTYKTLDEWRARREVLRQQILSATGLMPMPPKSDLHAQIFARVENKDYSIEKVLLEILPGVYLGGNLYRPLRPAPQDGFPGVISPHGHWEYGRLTNNEIVSIPARCITLARQGYVVWSYDMVGYNDTIQTPHEFGDNPEQQLWSFGPIGLQLWSGIRGIDFLQSLAGVNPNKIGATGASGGATQTILVSAVDDRIQFSAPANMVSLIMQGGSLCENAPNLRLGTNNVELAAMMAPRPMLMAGATGDWTRNMLREEYPAVRAIYDLYGKGENVETFFQDAPHNYNKPNREAMYVFFGKHVLGERDASKLTEKAVHVEPLQNMLVLHDRKLPDAALNFQQIFELWKQLASAPTENGRERLRLALAAEWPDRVISQTAGDRIFLGRPGKGDRIPAVRIAGTGPPALVVHAQGAETARQSPEVEQLIRAGRSVLLIDAFQTGIAQARRDRSVKMFLTFNKSDDANRVQDILTALAWLNTPRTRLVGLGKAAVWCLFAAAVAPEPVDLDADLGSFHGADQDFIDNFFVPGIQHAGGLRAALLLAGRAKN